MDGCDIVTTVWWNGLRFDSSKSISGLDRPGAESFRIGNNEVIEDAGGRIAAFTDGLRQGAERFPRGLGIAIKVADGDPGSGVRPLVRSRLLAQLDPEHLAPAAELDDGLRRNNRGMRVGARRVLFQVSVA